MTTIVAVDPGKVCGVFMYPGPLNATDVLTFEGPAVDALEFIDRYTPADTTHFVAERFTFSPKMTHQYDAIEVIGVLRWFAHRFHCQPTLQSRSARTRVSYDDLRDIGWYTTTDAGHVNEAARHALVYLAAYWPHHPLVMKLVGMIETVE